MLRPNLDELLLGDYDDKVPESPSGRPGTTFTCKRWWKDPYLVDKTDPPAGASKLVPDTTGHTDSALLKCTRSFGHRGFQVTLLMLPSYGPCQPSLD